MPPEPSRRTTWNRSVPPKSTTSRQYHSRRRGGDTRQDSKFILQLSHGGRQQDIAGIENLGRHSLSPTDREDDFEGFDPDPMTRAQIRQTIQHFADGARRARDAGLDGVELH